MTYKPRGFKRFDIVERGKLRHIQSVHISERVSQKLVSNYALKPTIYPTLIFDNTASQEGKGTEQALARLREHLRAHYARYGTKGAIATIDFHDYFGSIPHAGAIKNMTRHISDERINHYVAMFVDAFDGEVGLGLGSEESQLGAISYPTPIDKMVKEQFGIKMYARYMDDCYLGHESREYVEYCVNEIKKKAAEYGLEVNERKTKIHNLATDDFVFLKKRVRLTPTGKVVMRLTRKNISERRKRIVAMRAEYDAGRMPLESILQSYQAWRGYAKKYDSYHTVGDMDKFFHEVMGDILEVVS